jgi:hypothetical protein
VELRTSGYKKDLFRRLDLYFPLCNGLGAVIQLSKPPGKMGSRGWGGIEAIDSARIFLVYGANKKAIISYKADFTKSPCWFDFDVKDSAQTLHLKSLLLFINADTLQWEIFEDGVRPDNFTSEKGDMVYLKRKK